MNKLVALINAAVERDLDNVFKFYLATVLTDEQVTGPYSYLMPDGRTSFFDSDNLCVAVSVVNDKSADSDNVDSYDKYGVLLDPMAPNANTINDTPTIYPFVRLQAGGVSNGPFQVPAPGSQVYIAVSNWADPFIVIYSAVFLTSNTMQTADKLSTTFVQSNPENYFKVVTNNDSTGNPISGSVEEMTNKGFYQASTNKLTVSPGDYDLSVLTNIPSDAEAAYIAQNQDGIWLAANKQSPSMSVNMNGLMIAFKTTTDNVNNNLKSLNTQLQNLVTILGTPVLYGTPTGYTTPPVYTSLAPITSSLSTIATNLASITEDLDTGSTSLTAAINALFLNAQPTL